MNGSSDLGGAAETTTVISIGLERYEWGTLAVPGAAGQAVRFAQWALSAGVPADRVHLGCTWLDEDHEEAAASLGVQRAATETEPLIHTLDAAVQRGGDLLLFYWCGHGFVDERGDRRLLTSEASEFNLTNRYIADIQSRLRSDIGPGFPRQVFMFDACARDVGLSALPMSRTQPTGMRKAEQELFFSTEVGELAVVHGRAQGALFSTALLDRLESAPRTVLPDFTQLFEQAAEELEAREDSYQHPVRLFVDAGGRPRERVFGPAWPLADPADDEENDKAGWAVDLLALHEGLAREGRIALPPIQEVATTAHRNLLAALDSATDAHNLLEHAVERTLADATEDIEWLAEMSRPLTAQTTREALQTMWAVYEYAVEKLAYAPDRLHFILSAPRSDPAVFTEIAREWAGDHDEQLNALDFVSRVSVAPDDERGELLARLTDPRWRAEDPSAAVGVLVGALLDRLAGKPDRGARRQLDWAKFQRPSTMLTRMDREPGEVVPGEVLVAIQPTLWDIRRGSVARTDDLDRLEREYWEWVATLDPSSSVATFWVTGPSGAGKSVLLLQLLVRLSNQPGVTAEHLHEPSKALRAVELMSTIAQSRHVVIAADDPFDLVDGEYSDLWRVLASREPGPRSAARGGMVVLLCSAPTDLHNRFAAVKPARIPHGAFVHDPYAESFRSQLRTFFGERTGLPAAAPEAGTLPVQMFFEWERREGLTDFAHHFRRRISSAGVPELTTFIFRLFAINRLYVGYPENALETVHPAARDALNVLVSDRHIHLGAVGRPGFWFSHPHLVDEIYRTWFPDDRPHARREHLHGALADLLGLDPTGLASVPLLTVLTRFILQPEVENEARTRLETESAHSLVGDFLDRFPLDPDEMHPAALAAWIRAHAVAHRAHPAALVDSGLKQLTSLTPDSRELGSLAAALSTHPEVDPAHVWRVLHTMAWSDTWLRIAGGLVARDVSEADAQYLILVLGEHRDEPRTRSFLTELVRDKRQVAGMDQLCIELLLSEADQTGSKLGRLAEACMGRNLDVESAVAAWLTGATRSSNGWALTIFARRPHLPLDLVDAAYEWSVSNHDDDSAGLLFAHLLTWRRLKNVDFRSAIEKYFARGPTVPEKLRDQVVTLLNHENPAWSYFVGYLGPVCGTEPRIEQAIRRRLVTQAPSTEIVSAFITVASRSAALDAELTDVGRTLLKTESLDASYAHVVAVLVANSSQDDRDEFVGYAESWLFHNPGAEHGWGRVVPALAACAPGELLAIHATCLDWVRAHPENHEANYVLGALLNLHANGDARDRIIEESRAWITRAAPGWEHVFRAIVREVSIELATEIARPLLDERLHEEGWLAMFSRVVDQLTHDEVARLTARWFAEVESSSAEAAHVWSITVENPVHERLLDDASVRGAARSWLLRSGRAASWLPIWQALQTHSPDDMSLFELPFESGLPEHRLFTFTNTVKRILKTEPTVAPVFRDSISLMTSPEARLVLWLVMVPHLPDEETYAMGTERLPEAPDEEFDKRWRRLWKFYPDPQKRAALSAIAKERLARSPDPNSFPIIRERLRRFEQAAPQQAHRPKPSDVARLGFRPVWER